ncbi:MAG: choice-of-anchor J domain-containing protein [Brumimicrobium sp.]|nr:choice-of-anchor J domain-containing protein [Brumimicrobium sp.]
MKVFFIIIFSSLAFTSAAQIDILIENFDAASLPATWTVIDNDGNTPASQVSEYTEAWIQKEDPINSGNGTASSTSYFDPVNRADRWLISPQITLGGSGNFISWKGLSHDPSYPDSYKVMISTTSNNIADFTDTLVVISNELPDWTEHTEALEAYAGTSIYIAFVNTTFNGFKLYLDSVYVREQDPLSVENLYSMNQNKAMIYPNPATEKLFIGGEKIKEVEIISFEGKVMFHSDEHFNSSVDLTKYSPGFYFAVVRFTNGTEERLKFVKK